MLELDFALFHQFFHFEHGVLDCVTSVSKMSFFNLFVDPPYEFWQNAHGKLDFDYRPGLIIAYGKDVGMWFKSNKDPTYEEEFSFIANPRKLAFSYQLIYVPQRQGKHSRPEVNEVKAKIKEAILRARLRGGSE